MPDRSEIRTDVAVLLDRLRTVTGDPRFAHAAAMLRGAKAGRPPADDGPALGYAATLLDAELTRSRREACQRAAVLYAKTQKEQNRMADRLKNRFSKKQLCANLEIARLFSAH